MIPLVMNVTNWTPKFLAAARGLLPRIAKESPAMIPAIAARLRTIGVTVGSSVDDLMNYIKSNKMATANFLGAAASLGFAVSTLLPEVDEKTAETLKKVEAGVLGVMDFSIAAGAASASQVLAALAETPEQRANRNFVGDVLLWATEEYGERFVASAHLMAQSFFELSHEQVVQGLADGLHDAARKRREAKVR